MSEFLVDVTIPSVSGFPEDDVHNGFVFDTDPGFDPVADYAELCTPIADFYNAAQSTGDAVAKYMSYSLSRTASVCSMKLYEIAGHLDGSPHGSPKQTATWTLAAAASGYQSIPEECALVMTLNGYTSSAIPAVESADGSDPGSAPDRPLQRHRGRLYLGPWTTFAATDPPGIVRPKTSLITTLLDAAEDLQDAVVANGHQWSVWSRANEVTYDVYSVHVDNAWDTQRRRGTAPTSRTARTLIP